jgi:hypothetical protein
VQTTSGSRDGERMSEHNNGTSMKFLRPSRTTTGSHTHLISKAMETQPILDAPLLILDGGNCSDIKAASSRMRKERLLKFKVTLMLKTETLSYILKLEESTSYGMLCMLTNGKVNLEKESSMKTSACMLKETSTYNQLCLMVDTLT